MLVTGHPPFKLASKIHLMVSADCEPTSASRIRCSRESSLRIVGMAGRATIDANVKAGLFVHVNIKGFERSRLARYLRDA